MPTQRLTVTTEFPRAVTPVARAVTFALEPIAAGGPSGVAVVCVAARYASVRWHGDDRPTRLHLAPAQWREASAAVDGLADGIVVREDAGWVRVVTDGRALLRCTGVTDLQAGPFALVAALDALLAW